MDATTAEQALEPTTQAKPAKAARKLASGRVGSDMAGRTTMENPIYALTRIIQPPLEQDGQVRAAAAE